MVVAPFSPAHFQIRVSADERTGRPVVGGQVGQHIIAVLFYNFKLLQQFVHSGRPDRSINAAFFQYRQVPVQDLAVCRKGKPPERAFRVCAQILHRVCVQRIFVRIRRRIIVRLQVQDIGALHNTFAIEKLNGEHIRQRPARHKAGDDLSVGLAHKRDAFDLRMLSDIFVRPGVEDLGCRPHRPILNSHMVSS